MSTRNPELDTRAREAPAVGDRPHPTVGEAATVWLGLAAVTTLANLLVLGVATVSGAAMTADLGGVTQQVGWLAVAAATFGTLLVSTFAWALVAHRVPAFAHLWVPIGWGVGLVSLGGILGAAGLATGVALGAMHLLTTAVAAHAIPRRLPR